MKTILKTGEVVELERTITPQDVAAFNGKIVHPVYSTFSLARDAEETSRQFVLAIRDEDEEGIGTRVSVDHKSPAFVGERIKFTATLVSMRGNELRCSFEARVDDRVIATGETGQKVLKKEKLQRLFQLHAKEV